MEKHKIEHFAKHIVDAGYRVHQELGPGLLESVYLYCFMEEIKTRNITAEKEVLLPLNYRGKKLEKDFRIDILVENEIILEIKAVELLLPVHTAQLISYLKLADKRLGFLINFNVTAFKEGIHRYVNNY
jgi:GxxExxY protein